MPTQTKSANTINYAQELLKTQTKTLLKKHNINAPIETPPENIDADLAMPTFALAKTLKKPPHIIAQDLQNSINPPKNTLIKQIKAQGPYLNFYKDNEKYTGIVLKNITSAKQNYGKKPEKKQKVMIEYSQANTHKAFHVGHIRGTSLGESLARTMKHEGYHVTQANYQGDTGAHVAKWLWCYLKFHKNETPPKKQSEKWIASIYVESVKKTTKENQKEIDKINSDLENNTDPNLTALWKKTREWSLKSLQDIYKDLDAHFDHYFFERQMETRAKEIVKDLLKSGIAKIDQDATIIDLRKYNLGIWVLLRKDGTCLYSAKDIALAEKKFKKYNIDKSIYIIGAAQSLHAQQLFKTLELMNFKNAKNCHHLSFAEVRLPTGKMSSRTGENILYTDMLEELLAYAKQEVTKRHPGWTQEEKDTSAKNITICALKFSMLNQSPNKLITFSPKEALNFEGDTGPYIQYTHARAHSILRQATFSPGSFNPALLKEKEELDLIKKLSQFPEAVTKTCEQYDPNQLTSYLLELSHDFNTFYHKHPVLKAQKELSTARLTLVQSTMQVLNNGLYLLAITAPKQM
ncbi:MAG: arginine--tRNA ligase [Candidatus Nanohalarchaeota archaeon]|nr:MAG: arginine--tRNA ligase [Candidatus Nanohaloarchaeota archaeon]